MSDRDSSKDWTLDRIAAYPGVRWAVVLTSDGLLTAKSKSVDRDAADVLSAGGAGLHSIASSLSTVFHIGEAQHQTIAFDQAVLFIRAAGERSYLAVLTDRTVDPALLTQLMLEEIKRMNEHLASAPRHAAHTGP